MYPTSDFDPRPPRRPGGGLLDSPPAGVGLRGGLQAGYQVLRRYWTLAAGVFGLTLAAAVWFVAFQPHMYQAESLLSVEDAEARSPDDALNMGFVADPTAEDAASQLLTLQQSSELAQRVAERLLDADGDVDREASASSPADPSPEVSALAERIRSTVTFTPYEPNAIGIAVTDTDPREAARIANAFADEAIAHSRDVGKRRVRESREFVEERLAQAQEELHAAEATLQAYMRREGAAGLDAEVQTVVADGTRLESAIRQAQVDLQTRRASIRATEAELRRIRPRLSQRVASGIDREIEAAQQEIAALEVRLEQFYQNYPDARANPDGDPRTQQIRDALAEWRRRVDALSQRYVQEALSAGGANPTEAGSGMSYAAQLDRQLVQDRIAISGLEAQIAAQRGQLSGYGARRRDIPEQSVGLAQQERRRATAEQLYTYLAGKLQEVAIAEGSEIGSLRLLRAAAVPAAPVNRSPGRVLSLAALLGLLLGFGAAVVRSRVDARMYTPEDVEAAGLPLLGVVPNMARTGPAAERTEADGPSRKASANVVALRAPHSAMAEAYRHLYTRLQFSRPDCVAQVVLVTSPEVGAGKSTTAINLAATMARANRRTLIIDADLRRPSVARYLGVESGPTLEDLLAQGGDVEEAVPLVESAFADVWNLYALTTREPVAVPMEHLTSARMRELLGALRTAFDTIVIDTPPLLIASDAALLAPLCDAAILVVSSGQTNAAALVQMQRELEDAGGHVAGVVLNQFDPTDQSYRNTYGYRQRHYAAYHDQP